MNFYKIILNFNNKKIAQGLSFFLDLVFLKIFLFRSILINIKKSALL